MKRHIAVHTETFSRFLTVLLQIPERPDHALVVQVDGLPPRFEQTVMGIAESAEGQAEIDLAQALARRIYEDSGKTVLTTLHEAGLLKPVHVDKITMMPHPSAAYPLRTVLEQMGRTVPGSAPVDGARKFNPLVNNMQAASAEERIATARNLLFQADDLQIQANRKREQAYTYAPELRPAETAQASLTEVRPVAAAPVLNEAVDETADELPAAPARDEMLSALMEVVEQKQSVDPSEAAAEDDVPTLSPDAIADLFETKPSKGRKASKG